MIATSHTERNGRIRLISARKAEKKLENLYNEWLKKVSDSRLKEIAKYDVNFDDDIPEFTDAQLAMFRPVNPQYYNITPKKKAISIKIDVDVLEALKKQGKGYQTRINNILRKAVL